MKTLFKTIYGLLIVGVVILGLLLLATLMPIPGNLEVKIVKSGSMEPAIPVGSIVVIKSASQYAIGDVITFGKDTKTQIPTTHRIIETNTLNGSQIFVTKGDANDAADPVPTRISEVKGKVIASLPYIGYVLDFGRQPLGFGLLVGVPALAVIIDEVGKIIIEIRSLKRRKRSKQTGDEEAPHTPTLLVDNIKTQDTSRASKTEDKKYSSDLFSPKMFVVIMISIGTLVGLSSVGSTVSYFNDMEASLGNFLKAGMVDLRLSANDSSGEERATSTEESLDEKRLQSEAFNTDENVGSSFFQINIDKDPKSIPFDYRIEAELAEDSDPGCENLELDAWIDEYRFEGLLKDFSLPKMSLLGTWYFMLNVPIENLGMPAGTMCAGEIIFSVELTGVVPVLNTTFTDEERYPFKIYNYNFPASVEVESPGETVTETLPEEVPEDVEEPVIEDVSEQTEPEDTDEAPSEKTDENPKLIESIVESTDKENTSTSEPVTPDTEEDLQVVPEDEIPNTEVEVAPTE
jgi:signal peptidase